MDACETSRIPARDPERILAFVLAGDEGRRLHPLTATCPKPMLPFAGRHIIDFVLSNLVNSGIRSIYVLAQYKAAAIERHVESAWNGLWRRSGGFVKVVTPRAGAAFEGTADALYKNLDLVRRHAPDVVAVFAADHVYRMDVLQMVRFHDSARADLTMAALPVPMREARTFGAIRPSIDGRVGYFEQRPADTAPVASGSAYVSMGNYVFEPAALAQLLSESRPHGESDFGRSVLTSAPGGRRVFAYDFTVNRVPGLLACEEPSYWRDVGTLSAYLAAQEDLMASPPRFCLDNPQWPIWGSRQSMPVSRKAA